MKIASIVAYISRDRFGHEANFVPPITGIHAGSGRPLDGLPMPRYDHHDADHRPARSRREARAGRRFRCATIFPALHMPGEK